MLHKLFKSRPRRDAGERLYAAAVAQARRPEFYTALGVEDRIDARFELYTLHVILLMRRLRGQGEGAGETAQALFDEYVGALDDALRELGVGDLSVAKKMRKLGEAIYGRIKAYDEALDPQPDHAALAALIARTVFADEAAAERAGPLADYVLRAGEALAAQPLPEVMEGKPAWPEPR
ncbi:MAG TPA: ubiquinol-cytochrome C chaperone family protein [Caulobacteraceae bacterium]|nr:ubiquinol-cytochrome C chaperone family protein [Caulobacteraceae bacterium]